jgi:hypothetical protein
MSYDVFVDSPSPKATGHNALIGDLLVRTGESVGVPIVIGTENVQAERQDDAASIYEEVDDIGFTFSRFNHTGGEGLSWYPPRSGKIVPELDPIRYFDSKNLFIGREVDDIPYRVELAKAFSLLDTSQTFVDTFASNDKVYYAYSLSVIEADDWDGTNPITHTLTGTTGPIITLFGSRSDTICAITTEGDLFVMPQGATAFALAYEAGVDGEALVGGWWAKGRVIASRHLAGTIETNELIEIAPAMGGTPPTPVVTVVVTVLESFSSTVWSVVDASIAIVVAYSNGELHTFVPQTDTAGGAPVLTVRGTTPMPTSEVPYLLGYGSGKLVILTAAEGANGRKRAYTAEVLDERFDFVVGQLQLVKEWAETTDVPDVRGSMVSTRNAIWWMVNDIESGQCELWNYDTVTTGVFNEVEVGAADGIALSSFQDRFGLLLGDEVWSRDQSLYADGGYIITPNINFGRTSDIAWVNAVLEVTNVGAGTGSVSLYVASDSEAIYDEASPAWQLIGTMLEVSQTTQIFQLNNLTNKQLAMKVVIEPATNRLDTPQLLRYSIRGIATARDWVVQVPVNVSDLIEVPNRQPLTVPGWGREVLNVLESMEGEAVDLTIYEPPGVYQGIIDRVATPIEYVADRGSSSLISLITLRGKRITGGAQFSGTNSWAQAEYGVSLWATGEGEAELV